MLLDEHADVICEAVKAVAAEMMELEVAEPIGAEREASARGSRDASHGIGRGGGTRAPVSPSCRSRRSAGAATSRASSSFLEPRRRSEQALVAVVQQAYVCGVSTRRVDQLVESLRPRISRSEVSRVCQALEEHVEAFRSRPLEGRCPYRFLDAKVEKIRDGGRVVNKALVVAHGVHESGRREILSIDVGLVRRGLIGVQLAISDAHAGRTTPSSKLA